MSDRETEMANEQIAPRSAAGPEAGAEHWERDLINRLLFATLNEQRRARRWGIFFKSLGFAYLFILLLMIFGADMESAPIRPARHGVGGSAGRDRRKHARQRRSDHHGPAAGLRG